MRKLLDLIVERTAIETDLAVAEFHEIFNYDPVETECEEEVSAECCGDESEHWECPAPRTLH